MKKISGSGIRTLQSGLAEVNQERRVVGKREGRVNSKAVVMEREIKVNWGRNNSYYSINVRMGFDAINKNDLISWAFEARLMTLKHTLLCCTEETLRELSKDGYKVDARKVEARPVTDGERRATLEKTYSHLDTDDKAILLEILLEDGMCKTHG